MTAKKSKGSELERMVREILASLSSRGMAWVWKLPTDLRLTRTGLAHGEPMPADFMGWRRDGRVILIECKDVNRASLPLGKTPGVSAFQLQAMHFAHLAHVDYILLWKRKEEFVTIKMSGDPIGDDVPRIRWKSLPSDYIFPMVVLPECLEAAIMSQHETPISNGFPVAPRVQRMRHRRANRRAGPPPAPR